jgi:hypothetical protein
LNGLVRLWVGEKKPLIRESKVGLAVVILINIVLWGMVIVAIWGTVQQITAPTNFNYPIAGIEELGLKDI